MLSNLVVACALTSNIDASLVSMVDGAADKYRIPRSLMHAIVHQESKYKPSAINKSAPVTSYGLGQLTKTTALEKCGLNFDHIMSPKLNLYCSAKYLAWQMKRYKNDEFKAISAYNMGSHSLKNHNYTLAVYLKYINCHK